MYRKLCWSVLIILLIFSGTHHGVSYATPPNAGDLLGTWNGTLQSQRGPIEQVLVFRSNGGTIVGDIEGQGNTITVRDVTVAANGALSWSFKFKRREQEVTVVFAGKLSGDAIAGNYDFGGRNLSFSATRTGSSSKPAVKNDIVGIWSGSAVYQGENYPVSYEFSKSKGRWSGVVLRGANRTPLKQMVVEDDLINFSTSHPDAGPITIELRINGNAMSGTVSGTFGEAIIKLRKE
jgi:hypothetical protein